MTTYLKKEPQRQNKSHFIITPDLNTENKTKNEMPFDHKVATEYIIRS